MRPQGKNLKFDLLVRWTCGLSSLSIPLISYFHLNLINSCPAGTYNLPLNWKVRKKGRYFGLSSSIVQSMRKKKLKNSLFLLHLRYHGFYFWQSFLEAIVIHICLFGLQCFPVPKKVLFISRSCSKKRTVPGIAANVSGFLAVAVLVVVKN